MNLAPGTNRAAPETGTGDRSPVDRAVKDRVYDALLSRLNLDRLAHHPRDQVEPEIRALIDGLLAQEAQATPLDLADCQRIAADVLNELFGLGPLEALVRDPAVTAIFVNRADRVYVERGDRFELTDTVFRDARHILQIIERLVSSVGRRIDESSPLVDARLPDGSRVNVVIPPLALDGPALSIRRYRVEHLDGAALVERQTLTQEMLDFLAAAVSSRRNLIVSGGSGSGKTTMLNLLGGFIPDDERIVTIEEAAELNLGKPHVVRLETRPPNIEGKGEVGQARLLANALRMWPDRIVVGELGGDEALAFLEVVSAGQNGTLATINATSPHDALSRLETLATAAATAPPERTLRRQLASAVDLIVHVTRLADGTRRIAAISETAGLENGLVTLRDLFVFEATGLAPDRRIGGRFQRFVYSSSLSKPSAS